MIIQDKAWTCGPAAVVNALQCVGVRTTEKKALKHTSTTRKTGTDSPGIMAALKALGAKKSFSFDEENTNTGLKAVDDGHPVIVPIHGWQHWVVVVARTHEGLYLVIDSGRTARNELVGGFHVITLERLSKIWEHAKKGLFSGVVVKL